MIGAGVTAVLPFTNVPLPLRINKNLQEHSTLAQTWRRATGAHAAALALKPG